MRQQYILYILIVLASSLLLTGCTKKDDGYDSSKVKVIGTDDQNESSNQEQTQETTNESEGSEDLGYLSNPNEFSKSKQSVGEITEGTFALASIEDATRSGYHEIAFKINALSDLKVLPLVTAESVLEKGVLRVTLNGVEKDSSGIPFQQSRLINKGAIENIYHSVTSKESIAIYEVGIAGNNPFKLESQPLEEGTWLVLLKVAYDTKYSPPSMDLGSAEFRSDVQEISGVTAVDGARISSYSYSVTGDTLRFVFTVSSGTSNPIPSVSASYDEQNILQVTFSSLVSDKIPSWGKNITLPAGIVVEPTRSGESSTYKFGGIGGKNNFKLSASKSPNQVIVEIKLK